MEHTQPLGKRSPHSADHSQPVPGCLVMGRATISAFPLSLQQNLGGIWEHTCSWLLLTSVECESRQGTKCPWLQTGILEGLQGSNKRPGLSVEHHCLYCNITEAWQVPLSASSLNGNTEQLSYSSLSPRKSVQKLMVWDVSYSGVASPQSCFAEIKGSLSEGSNSAGK